MATRNGVMPRLAELIGAARDVALEAPPSPAYWRLMDAATEVEHQESGDVLPLTMVERPCDVAALRAREKLRLIQFADLPGGGWGDELERVTGGGFAPGDLVGLGAAGTGVGKTAFLMQLLDGLALRSSVTAENPDATAPLTPVFILSEMDAVDLECRTLGRLVGAPGSAFAAGESARRMHSSATVAAWYDQAAAAMAPDGEFARLARWQHIARAGTLAGPSLLKAVEAYADGCIARIRLEHPHRQVVPVLALDPINSFLTIDDRSEVQTLGELSALLDEVAERRRWIVLFTTETNKDSAKVGPQSGDLSAAAVYRGTMQLLHRCDLALVLAAGDIDADGVRLATVKVDKNRRGPTGASVSFRFHVASGLRFTSVDRESPGSVGDKKRAERRARGERLRADVASLVDQGETVTERKLEGLREFMAWLPKNKVRDAVTAAIADGFLRRGEKAVRGGGRPLFPAEVPQPPRVSTAPADAGHRQCPSVGVHDGAVQLRANCPEGCHCPGQFPGQFPGQ